MTPYEFSLLTEHNYKLKKNDSQLLRNVIFNANANLHREEGTDEIPLFDDSQEQEMDEEEIIKEREALFGEFTK